MAVERVLEKMPPEKMARVHKGFCFGEQSIHVSLLSVYLTAFFIPQKEGTF